MTLLERLLRRLGYIRLMRYDLSLTSDGRVFDAHSGRVLGACEPLVPVGLPSMMMLPPANDEFDPAPTPNVEPATDDENAEWEAAMAAARERARSTVPSPPTTVRPPVPRGQVVHGSCARPKPASVAAALGRISLKRPATSN